MFTGLVEEIGTIARVEPYGDALRITVSATTVLGGLGIDDSVAIDGCCQTVVALNESSFTVIAVEETLKKTTFGSYAAGCRVNLERAMQLGARLGGHLVLGHVDIVGKVVEARSLESSWLYGIEYPQEFASLVIPVGSITVNGVSLTAAEVEGNRTLVSIIPHTHELTTFGSLGVGDSVNLEFDMIGKYIRNFVRAGEMPPRYSGVNYKNDE